jgi:hypothetical protein
LENLSDILNGFEPISLEEMDAVELMDRTDTKFLLSKSEFYRIIPELQANYRTLSVEGNRISKYETLYYDTPEFEFYDLHQRGKKNRYKIRMRKYVDSDLSFLEVKFKNNKGRTLKHRKVIPQIDAELSENDKYFIAEMTGLKGSYESKIMNRFDRITLVNKNEPERLTFDINLGFDQNGELAELPEIVIAELKQEDFNRCSTFAKLLKDKHIRPERVSKYCLGIALMETDVKKNLIKEKLKRIAKISDQSAA